MLFTQYLTLLNERRAVLVAASEQKIKAHFDRLATAVCHELETKHGGHPATFNLEQRNHINALIRGEELPIVNEVCGAIEVEFTSLGRNLSSVEKGVLEAIVGKDNFDTIDLRGALPKARRVGSHAESVEAMHS